MVVLSLVLFALLLRLVTFGLFVPAPDRPDRERADAVARGFVGRPRLGVVDFLGVVRFCDAMRELAARLVRVTFCCVFLALRLGGWFSFLELDVVVFFFLAGARFGIGLRTSGTGSGSNPERRRDRRMVREMMC